MNGLDPRRGLRFRNLPRGQRLRAWHSHGAEAGRVGADDRVEHRLELRQLRIVESRTRSAGIDELAVDQVAELQRADVAATALRGGEADDDEVPGRLDLDLQPLVTAAGQIGSVCFLGDQALEPELPDLLEESLTFARNVVECADNAELRKRLEEQRLAFEERKWSEIEILEGDQVEREERGRQRNGGAPDLDR